MPAFAMAATVNLTATIRPPSFCGNNIREPGEQCDGSDLGGMSCSALGFNGGALSCTTACTFNVSVCAAPTDNVFASTFPIGGGQYSFTAGASSSVSLTVPPASYDEAITLEAFSYTPSNISATSSLSSGNLSFVGDIHQFTFISADGEVLHTLLNPVTIVMPYSDEDIAGLDPHSLAVYRHDDGDIGWSLVPGSVIDLQAKTATFTTSLFSSFAIMGEPASSPTIGSVAGEPGGSSSIGSFIGGLFGGLKQIADNAWSVLTGKPAKQSPENTVLLNGLVRADLNGNGSVGLDDFSILAYWYGRPNPPSSVDMNNDGVIDLADFSIMAHYYDSYGN
jgi:hypothetical protein